MRKINSIQKWIPIEKILEKGIIKLNPDYQRNHRWNDSESSRLMESLILNIPIPTVYLSQDVDVDEEVDDDVARYSVIDGQQRLTAIYGFMTNAYKLEGLEVLRAAEKATFPLERGKGVRIYLYCFFVSPDGKRFSNSQYIKL